MNQNQNFLPSEVDFLTLQVNALTSEVETLTPPSDSNILQVTFELETELKAVDTPVKITPTSVLADDLFRVFIPMIREVLTEESTKCGESVKCDGSVESVDQIPTIQDIGEFVVSTPFPDFSIYEVCEPGDLTRNGKSFDQKLAARAQKFIQIFIGRIFAEFTNLASTHSAKLIVDECVQLSFRPRVSADLKSQTLSREEELLKKIHEFPDKVKVNSDIEISVPHKEGLAKSAVYTVFASKDAVDSFCKGLKKGYVLTKDQPKDQRLIRFRIFGANQPGYVKGSKKAKEAKEVKESSTA